MGRGCSLKADVKTNPVAPMPATPQRPHVAAPQMPVPGNPTFDLQSMMSGMSLGNMGVTMPTPDTVGSNMLQSLGGAGAGGAAGLIDPAQQQMLMQYQQMLMSQMATVQNLMVGGGRGTGANLPNMPVLNPQLAAGVMMPQPGMAQAGGFYSPASLNLAEASLMNTAATAVPTSVPSAGQGYGQFFDMRGRGRGGGSAGAPPGAPGGLQNKPS